MGGFQWLSGFSVVIRFIVVIDNLSGYWGYQWLSEVFSGYQWLSVIIRIFNGYRGGGGGGGGGGVQ